MEGTKNALRKIRASFYMRLGSGSTCELPPGGLGVSMSGALVHWTSSQRRTIFELPRDAL